MQLRNIIHDDMLLATRVMSTHHFIILIIIFKLNKPGWVVTSYCSLIAFVNQNLRDGARFELE